MYYRNCQLSCITNYLLFMLQLIQNYSVMLHTKNFVQEEFGRYNRTTSDIPAHSDSLLKLAVNYGP